MWTPRLEGVEEVRVMLRQGADVKASTETLNQVRARLDHLTSTNPVSFVQSQSCQVLLTRQGNQEFIRYLAYIFANATTPSAPSSSEVAARALSGVLLKNVMKEKYQNLDMQTLAYIYDSVLPCLKDTNQLIRSTAAHILAKLVARTGLLQNGSDLLQRLEQCVRQEDDDFLSDGASLALLFIAEDAGAILDSDEAGRPLNHLIPFWIDQANHVKPLLRERALDFIECFFSSTPRALSVNVHAYLIALSRLQNDASTRVRKKVIRALGSLVQYMPEHINPDLYVQMAQFSLTALDDEEDDVAREACEFFDVSLAEGSSFYPLLAPLLPRLVPMLLTKMTYREEELFELEDELKDDANLPDLPQEWKPTFQTGTGGWSARPVDLQRDEGRGDSDDGEGTDDGPYWTTRRIASLVLDRLSKHMDHRQLAQQLLPTLFTRLQSLQWTERESAILALGAVAPGLIEDLQPYVAELVPYLISQARDESRVLIRRISLWTISRLTSYVVSSPFLAPTLEVVLARFGDPNKSVQASALGTMAEIFAACEGKQVLMPYLRTIIEQMSAGLDRLQMNNVCHLLDAFTALFKYHPTCDYVGDPVLIQIYMPKIWSKFVSLAPGDARLASMTWCLAQACATLGQRFFPFAEPAIQRCCDIMEETLSLAQAAKEVDEPLGFGDFEHLQCTLELLSSLVTALKTNFVQSPNARITALLVFRCASLLPDPDVIEVAVGVLGDICASCPDLIRGSEIELMKLFCGIAEDFAAARMNSGPCRNAVWAFSELVLSFPNVVRENPLFFDEGVRQIAGPLMLQREEKIEWAYETADVAAILCGNLFLSSPEMFDQSFSRVGNHDGHPVEALQAWTKILIRMNESIATRLRCMEAWALFIIRRPEMARGFVSLVLVNIATLDMRQVNVQLHQVLLQLLAKLKALYGAEPIEWEKRLKPLNESMRIQLREVYGFV